MADEKRVDVLALLERLGYKGLLSPSWYAQIDSWHDWYVGKTDFHKYSVYNGKQMVDCSRKTLGMPKKVCEDKADLQLNEKVEIVVSIPGQERDPKTVLPEQAFLDDVLDRNNFWVRGNQLIEKASALGTGAFVEYIANGEVGIDYIHADMIFPLSWENGNITECAFVSINNAGKDGQQVYINRHVVEDGRYVVYNDLFDSDGEAVELPEGTAPRWETGYQSPLFQIVTPNIVNNVAKNNPMGVSVYANSLDALKSIDAIFDSYYNEFVLGRKRIFIDGSLVSVDIKDGGIKPTFDNRDVVFYGIPGLSGDDESGKKITESNMTLRVEEHQQALQAHLDVLSENVGFGKGYYKFDADNVQTATAVISQNSKLYRKIKKDEIILEKALIDMVRAVLFLGNMLPGWAGKLNTGADISINFDDSIIEDTAEIQRKALLEYNAELIDKVQYFMDTRNLEESAAIEFVAKMEARNPELEPDLDLLPPLGGADDPA
ncbi:phage portal protein [Ruminococcaceae bacterium OttesenSCG-928-D13]|nr:phage portal protein [Ruminococcaceae bacterium OttesenSCG-928-D13]